MDLIIADVDAAIKHYYAVGVIIDVVVFYPAEATLYAEDAFRTRLVY